MLRIAGAAIRLTRTGLMGFCQVKQPNNENAKQFGPKEFSQLDIRVGEILECWKHPQSENLYCEKIRILNDPELIIQVASGLQKYVQLEQMRGKVIVMVNLKPRKVAGFESQGMLVCATSSDQQKCEIIVPDGQVGERLALENCQQLFQNGRSLLGTVNPKRKILERALQDFKTNQQGLVEWKGIKLKTSKGYLKTSIARGTVS